MSKKKTKKKKTKKKAKKKAQKKVTSKPAKVETTPYKRPPPELKKIFAIDACHIPHDMQDDCMDINDEFPLHYATGIVRVPDNGNRFSEWMKTIGFQFNDGTVSYGEDKGKAWGYLAVWGT